MDPKLDLSTLPSILADLCTHSPTHSSTLSNGTHHFGKSLVSQNKENVPTSSRPAGQEKTPPGQGLPLRSSRAGQLLSLLSSPSNSSSSKKSDRYQGIPKLSLVLSGCHAVLQFLGCHEKLPGTLLGTGIYSSVHTCTCICM